MCPVHSSRDTSTTTNRRQSVPHWMARPTALNALVYGASTRRATVPSIHILHTIGSLDHYLGIATLGTLMRAF